SLYYSLHLPALHSFPTRRSSDLFDPFSTHANPSGGYIRDQFPDNIIPASLINPVSANLTKFYPLPSSSGAAPTNANNYYNTGSRSEEHTSELQSLAYLVCRLLLE